LKPLRIGCVKYINARPLIRGWPGEVEFDHPSILCQRLANAELDVALVSSLEYLRNPIYQIVDGVSISSHGPVYSVVVAHCGDFSDVEEIVLDPASQTSVNLLRCLLVELGLKPRLRRKVGNRRTLQEAHHAQLFIGDQAIQFRQKQADEFKFWDLGEQWKKLTGLPFVYALWLIRPEIADAKSIAHRLRELRDKNLASLDDVIAEVAGVADLDDRKLTQEFLTRYYRSHLRFSFGENEKRGLQYFAKLCARDGGLSGRHRPFRIV
jgi:chorismate dehydratase